MEAEAPRAKAVEAESEVRLSVKLSEPGSLQARAKAAAPIRETAGGVTEVGGGSSVVVGAPDADVMEGWSDGRSVGVVRKCMLCYCQSIKGL